MFHVHDSDRFSTRLQITSTQNAVTLPMIYVTESVKSTSCQTCCNFQNLFVFFRLVFKEAQELKYTAKEGEETLQITAWTRQ